MMDGMKEELIAIVGEERVCDSNEILEYYSKDGSFAKPLRPRMVVKVKDACEVEQIVQLANRTQTPLVPVSSGGPHYKGDTVPGVPEAVIVDLSGMKKILNINRQQRITVVEPGVTYGELQDALAQEGLTLAVPLAPKATKSVVASVLDIEPRLNALHQWNFIDPLRCTEVIWGDGNRMYTGEAGGASPDLQKQWETQRWQVSGTGPMMLDFYRLLTGSQGTMGIVTWASLKCEVNPKVHEFFIVPAQKAQDLYAFVYRVLRLRFSNELMIVNRCYLAALLGENTTHIQELRDDLPGWAALVGIAGRELLPEARVRGQEQDITATAQQYGLRMLPAVRGAGGETIRAKVMNPSGAKYWKETYKGAFQDLFFTTTLDKTAQFIVKMFELAVEAGYPVHDIGVYIQPQHMGVAYHCEFYLPYNAESRAETDRVQQLFTRASEAFSGMGAYFLRPHGIWSRLQLNKDAQSAMLLKQLKGVFDPNNIMNTGKLCI